MIRKLVMISRIGFRLSRCRSGFQIFSVVMASTRIFVPRKSIRRPVTASRWVRFLGMQRHRVEPRRVRGPIFLLPWDFWMTPISTGPTGSSERILRVGTMDIIRPASMPPPGACWYSTRIRFMVSVDHDNVLMCYDGVMMMM